MTLLHYYTKFIHIKSNVYIFFLAKYMKDCNNNYLIVDLNTQYNTFEWWLQKNKTEISVLALCFYIYKAIYSYFNAASKQSNGLFSPNDTRAQWLKTLKLGQRLVFDMLTNYENRNLLRLKFFFQTLQSSFRTCENDAKELVLEEPAIHVTSDEKS